MENYKRTKTTISLINYHFVFCPRYRRKIFLDEKVELRFKEMVHEICESLNIKVVALECGPDHTHMFLNSPPMLSPANIMAKVKGVTSRQLRGEFQHLRHLPSLWTRSSFVSTACNVSSQTIKRYVEQQKTRG